MGSRLWRFELVRESGGILKRNGEKPMDAQEFANVLDGRDRELREEIAENEEAIAMAVGLVVVYGVADDLMVFHGALSAEFDACSGEPVYVNADGFAVPDVNDCASGEDCPHWQAMRDEASKTAMSIKPVWCEDEACRADAIPWTFKTDIPHATFNIMDDGKVFCRGIVFALKNAGTEADHV